jgi:HD-like signal output (HDOD) protein
MHAGDWRIELETMTTETAQPAVEQLDIEALIGNIDHLPTPPVVFSQINRVLSNRDASVYDVAKIIAEDAGMSARVLRMANSAYYALPQPVASVRQAVVILGLESVRSVVLSAAVVEAFSGYQENPEFQDMFWRHSLATASAARVLFGGKLSDARVARGGEEGFCAGLLHDIGKLVMVSHMPKIHAGTNTHKFYRVVEDRWVEDDVVGANHAAIGGYLASRWKLPEVLNNAITHHHDLAVQNDEYLHLTKVVHLADYLAHWTNEQVKQRDKILPVVDWDVAAEFGISEETLPEIADLVRAEFGRSETFLEMARQHP